jgi:type III pantothenate kinase
VNARLLIDCGNTRLKWTLARNQMLEPTRAIGHGGDPVAASAAIEAEGVESIWISNVTGAERSVRMARQLMARFRAMASIARVRQDLFGLRVAYADESRFGVDRWLGLIAVWRKGRGAVCVAGAGTALTFDAVDAEGRHLGGVIAPGLYAAQRATLGSTRFEAGAPDLAYSGALGADTEAAVREGALHACAGLLDRLAARQVSGRRYLTGGDADILMPHLAQPWETRPQLVMEGLLTLSEHQERT